MAMTSLTVTQIDDFAWRADFLSDITGATYYVYVGGVLFTTTTATWTIIPIMSGEKTVYVTDDSGDVPSITVPADTVRIQWERTGGTACTAYHVWHKYAADSSYALVGEVRETGLWLYEWISQPLLPGASNFKIIAMRDGTACAAAWYYTVTVTAPPARPSVTMTYDPLVDLVMHFA